MFFLLRSLAYLDNDCTIDFTFIKVQATGITRSYWVDVGQVRSGYGRSKEKIQKNVIRSGAVRSQAHSMLDLEFHYLDNFPTDIFFLEKET